MTCRKVVALVFVSLLSMAASAQLPQPGDVVFGLSNSDPAITLELVRGPANGTGTVVPDIWNDNPFIQSMEFDNKDGISHNASGNLLGLNFGSFAGGGEIYSFSTTDASVTSGQLLGDTTSLDGGLSVSRLSSLSVSPDNDKIAVMGYDRGSVIVYDYTAGDSMGAGGSVANLRESPLNILYLTDTQGTAWRDNNTVLAFSTDGTLYEVDATSMNSTVVANVTPPVNDLASPFTALAYNPSVSPYLFASRSTFDGDTSTTTNTLFVLDPSDGYAVLNEVDLSTSSNTMREIALDADGNLFFSSFGSSADGAPINVILGASDDPAAIADNSSTVWYTSVNGSSFSGFDIAVGGVTMGVDGDFNDDGVYDCADIDALVAEIAGGSNNPDFDLAGDDGIVDAADLQAWLLEAGEANIGPERAYLMGDANLDGSVDVGDFNIWNQNKFTATAAWCSGDFNADGAIDVGDFNIWNNNKFQASDVSSVPEPSGLGLLFMGLVAVCRLARTRR